MSEAATNRPIISRGDDSDPRTAAVLSIIRGIGTELHLPEDRLQALAPDTSFDRDLGLDSLSRVELISRVERKFNVALPESAFSELGNVRDLLTAVARAPARPVSMQGPGAIETTGWREAGGIAKSDEAPVALPVAATTLADVLDWYADRYGARTHLMFCEGSGDEFRESALTYAQLQEGARKVASGLQSKGIGHGDAVAIMLPTSLDYFFSFFGILMLGAIPVPIYPPARANQIADHLQRHATILSNCQAKALIATAATKRVAQLLKLHATSLRAIESPEAIIACGAAATAGFRSPIISRDDVAFLQYTSGSTGNPKGVILTHANLLANIRAMGDAVKAGPTDIFVSWLPLYHDMGLIGAWLGSLYFAARFVVMSPFAFLGHPERWLRALHRYRGTLTSAPNFAYELCLKRVKDDDIQGLDLSSVRVMCNGAEAVSPQTVERFCARFASFGLQATAMMPVYGLAENAVGLAFPPLGRVPRIDAIERNTFLRSKRALPVQEGAPKAQLRPLRFVACGRPLRDHEIRIVDASDREIPERCEGLLQFRGPSATSGYLRNPGETDRLLHRNGSTWLDSGDLAYLAEGDIFVTGRNKDVIKHAGRNIYPEELEAAVGDLPGVRKGCVAVFGRADPKSGTEHLVVLAETRESTPPAISDLEARINGAVADVIGAAPDIVVLAAPHTVLKTSSGKIRRSASRALLESGRVDAAGSRTRAPRSVKWQLARFTLAAIPDQARRILGAWLVLVNAVWVWGFAALIMGLSWLALVSWPTLAGRWRIARGAARLVALAGGIKVDVEGRRTVPVTPCIFVANHSSYVDILVLTIALARPVTYAAKAELANSAVTRLPLKRLETEFIERFDSQQSVRDAQRLIAAAKGGRSLLYFPEGTFTRRPGLLPFHLGGFLTAVETGLPIVPIAIRGSRSILHDGSWVVRRGCVTVRFLPVITPFGTTSAPARSTWERALALRDATRSAILRYNAEPDLGEERIFV